MTDGTSWSIGVLPSGRLMANGGGKVADAFEKSDAEGLVSLVSDSSVSGTGDASVRYFTVFARTILSAVARNGKFDDASRQTEYFSSYAKDAPPMRGGEYVSDKFLARLHTLLADFVNGKVREKLLDSPSDFVRTLSPEWRCAGKLAFSLAANTGANGDEKPFVFMVSYVHRMNENNSSVHIPLNTALKKYSSDPAAVATVLDTLSRLAEKSPFVKKALDDKTIFRPSFRTAADAYAFVRDAEVIRDNGVIVRMAGLWQTGKPPRLRLDVTLEIPEKRPRLAADALAKFSVSAAIGDTPLTKEELDAILNTKGGLIRVKGQWVEASSEEINSLLARWNDADLLSETTSLGLWQCMRILSRMSFSSASGDTLPPMPEELCSVRAGERLKEMLSEITSSHLKDDDIPLSFKDILRPYQKRGTEFLLRLTSRGLGACLADDMGLGKTVQVLAFLQKLKEEKVLDGMPALTVAPASLLTNWQCECEKFAPSMKFFVLHSSVMTSSERDAFKSDPEKFLKNFDVVAVSYQYLTNSFDLFKSLRFPIVIADEAQMMKTASSARSRAVRSLLSSRRIALTGTPVENSLSDLWSLFDFIVPGLLGSASEFREAASGTDKFFRPLRRITSPFILRRMKTDKSIINDLPDKCEMRCVCNLTKIQAKFYKAAADALKSELASSEGSENMRRGTVLKWLLRLKQICNHPSQFSGSGDFSPEKSGKFLRLIELADEIASKGEKLLVFTQFREMTEHLHDLLSPVFGRNGLILHGGTSVDRRAEYVKLFSSPSGPPFFILSLKAAGTGLNLTAANHVIHFDRWWNPAVEDQATDRAYRIGQHRLVTVHKMVSSGTVEEKIDLLIAGKKRLASSVLAPQENGRNAASDILAMSDEELLKLISLEYDGEDD